MSMWSNQQEGVEKRLFLFGNVIIIIIIIIEFKHTDCIYAPGFLFPVIFNKLLSLLNYFQQALLKTN